MSIKRANVTSLQALAAWMQANAVPSIFKSVSYSSDVLTAIDADDNTVLAIKGTSPGYFRAYRTASGYIQIALVNFPAYNYKTIRIIGCDNGFIVDMTVDADGNYSRGFAWLVAKTNNDKVAVVFPSAVSATESQQYKTSLQHVAFGDSATLSTTTTFTPESSNQTVITPFITNADVGGKSYTPDAGYMPMHSAYSAGLGKFLLGADTYITNGYWCIKDGGAA